MVSKSPTKKRRLKKPNPRPKIEYPPVTTRTWIPPDERKHKKVIPPQFKYKKPEETTTKLEVSSLNKVWHAFHVHNDAAWLFGHYSQFHRRFTYVTNGYQGPCNCIVAIVFSRIIPTHSWTEFTLDGILTYGDHYYLESKRMLGDMHRKHIKLSEAYKSFYIQADKISILLGSKKYKGLVTKDLSNSPFLEDVVQEFFGNNEAGVLSVAEDDNRRYFAIWKFGRGYFLFDPAEHDEEGLPWKGNPTHGLCFVIRFPATSPLVQKIQANLKNKTVDFEIVACEIERLIHINTKYPACLDDANLESLDRNISKKVSGAEPPIRLGKNLGGGDEADGQGALDAEEDESEEEEGIAPIGSVTFIVEKEEVAQEAGESVQAPVVEKSAKPKKIPAVLDKPKAESVTYFREVQPSKQGILRAATHQGDANFSKYAGKQSLANCIAVLVKLKQNLTKHWTSRVVTEVLKLGERIYHDSMREVKDKKELTFKLLCKSIPLEDAQYSAVTGPDRVLGRLKSQHEKILDLLPALREALQPYGMVLLQGPLMVAVWIEGEFFYMFDPNERDGAGKVVVKETRVGSVMQVIDFVPGTACVTWFTDLKDLVELYMANVTRALRREWFLIFPIDIVPFIALPEKFHNFKPLTNTAWILRGSFSQADSKKFNRSTINTQCTANAAMALAVISVKPISEWTTPTMDQILMLGDAYYKDCVAELRSKNKYINSMLMCDELIREFMVRIDPGYMISMEVMECLVNGVVDAADNNEDGILNLLKGIDEFFKENDAGIVTSRCISIAMWQLNNCFYYFDSHGRDENGHRDYNGTSCIMKFAKSRDLAEKLKGNLGPATAHCIFNISRITMTVLEPETESADELEPPAEEEEEELANVEGEDEEGGYEEGVEEEEDDYGMEKKKKWKPKPLIENDLLEKSGAPKKPMHAFQPLNKVKAILRASFDEENDSIFERNAGKQCVPNLLMALGMTQLYVPIEWTEDTMNDILLRGNSYYNDCMTEHYKQQERINSEDRTEDVPNDITAENVLKQFMIGLNKFEMTLDVVKEEEIGIFGQNLREALEDFYKEEPKDEEDYQQAIVESDFYQVAIWRHGDHYFLFDSKPRTERGEVFGKGDWSIIMIPPPPEEDEEELVYNPVPNEPLPQQPVPKAQVIDPTIVIQAEPLLDQMIENYDFDDEEDEIPAEPAYPQPEKHGWQYWLDKVRESGRACTMWFSKLKYLIDHIVRNHPPSKREKMLFRLRAVLMTNTPQVRDVYDPINGPKPEVIAGDWKEFKEVDRGFWILRGLKNQRDVVFPENNRGKQSAANCLLSLAFAGIFSLAKYNSHTVDSILKYGDRLYTYTKKMRRRALQEIQAPALSPEEIEQLLAMDHYEIEDISKSFAIGDDMATAEVTYRFVRGEINAQEVLDEYDVQRGLEKFFKEAQFGLLESKGNAVAVWKMSNAFYMFDPQSRGPNGGKAEIGMACITRYVNISGIADLFLRNLPKDGSNNFSIHKVTIKNTLYQRPIQEEVDRPKEKPQITGFGAIVPGKKITRGSLSQQHAMFGRGANIQSAPIAFVALAMTLIHNIEYWTPPIVDEIILIGDGIYADVLEKDTNFNPWEQKFTIAMAPKDFKIGKIKVNCELRESDQRGIIDIKDPNILNLRQGMERFFEENTHGVIETELLTVAVWESEYNGKKSIYMFDPNPRCPSGMPSPDGAACVLKFLDTKLAADHFISLVSSAKKDEFLLTPVEMVCERDGKGKKTKKYGFKFKPALIEQQKTATKAAVQRQHILGRIEFYQIPSGELALLRGSRGQNSKHYSVNSRGNQDVPNCIISYVMEKLIPLPKWNYKTIDMILDVGDQLYKDSFVTFNPKSKKLHVGALLRDVVIKNVLVKISVGAPIMTARLSVRILTDALEACFKLKNSCIVTVDQSAISIFKKQDFYYLFDPQELDLRGHRSEGGYSSVLRFANLGFLVNMILRNLGDAGDEEKRVFYIIVVAIKEMQKIQVGEAFTDRA